MEQLLVIRHQLSSEVSTLISTALDHTKLSGLTDILKKIAESFAACGCILWQVAPGAVLDGKRSIGHLFVLAQWSSDNEIAYFHNLPLAASATGQAIINERPVHIDDTSIDQRINVHPFLEQVGIKTMCSIPITFKDNSKGALNLYRNLHMPFEDEEVAQFGELASIVPALYQAVKDKVSLTLIRRVDEVLHGAELAEHPQSKHEIKRVLDTICHFVAAAFQAMEASVFLQDHIESPDVYELMATTWNGPIRKTRYRREGNEGLTGWVLAHAEPVTVFDLANFERDRSTLRAQYPNLTWTDSLDIQSSVRNRLQLRPDMDLPPLSYMAAPIVHGNEVLGVIRCCAATQGPYYFATHEANMLGLVATQIGQGWSDWVSRRDIEDEIRSWRVFIQRIGKLNKFVHNELTRESPNEQRIFEKALHIASGVIKGAESMDIRLVDEQRQELYFAQTYGWSRDEEDNTERRLRRFPIAGEMASSAGAHVFRTRLPKLIDNIQEDTYYSEAFPETKRLIIAPIMVEDTVFGVLDIRGTGESGFARPALAIAELLGHQLGLYHYLANTIGQLRKAQVELSKMVTALQVLQQQQTQTFEDLKHQFYSPISQAYSRVQWLLETEFPRIQNHLPDRSVSEKGEAMLLAIRGLCAKAKQVAISTGLFAELARDRPIPVSLEPLKPEGVVKMTTEAAMDYELIVRSRNITFEVESQSFQAVASTEIVVDMDLLAQALMNVLDNAAKYSFSGTKVRIVGNVNRRGQFEICISNKGLAIEADDLAQCVTRGWRSDLARYSTGEGSGIGLWIVDHIMKAHKGNLVIVPTTRQGITKVKLVFPRVGHVML